MLYHIIICYITLYVISHNTVYVARLYNIVYLERTGETAGLEVGENFILSTRFVGYSLLLARFFHLV